MTEGSSFYDILLIYKLLVWNVRLLSEIYEQSRKMSGKFDRFFVGALIVFSYVTQHTLRWFSTGLSLACRLQRRPSINPALREHMVAERVILTSDVIPTSTRRWPNVGLMLAHRLRRWVGPMLGRCWPIVYDAGPTSVQHWVSASCLPGFQLSAGQSILSDWIIYFPILYTDLLTSSKRHIVVDGPRLTLTQILECPGNVF